MARPLRPSLCLYLYQLNYNKKVVLDPGEQEVGPGRLQEQGPQGQEPRHPATGQCLDYPH